MSVVGGQPKKSANPSYTSNALFLPLIITSSLFYMFWFGKCVVILTCIMVYFSG